MANRGRFVISVEMVRMCLKHESLCFFVFVVFFRRILSYYDRTKLLNNWTFSLNKNECPRTLQTVSGTGLL
jgi:hypothetical protein